jgi:hypothetical protein
MSDDARSEASCMQRSIRVLSNIRTPAAGARKKERRG